VSSGTGSLDDRLISVVVAVDLACVGDGWSLKAPASPGLFSKGFRWNCQRQLHAQRRQSARGARQRGPNPHSALPRVMQGHL